MTPAAFSVCRACGRRAGIRRPLEDAAGELAADHRGEPQHLARLQVQPVEAGPDHRLHGPGKPEGLERVGEDHRSAGDRELASLEQRLGDLLEKERIPAAVLVDQVHQPGRHRVHPQDRPKHRGRRLLRRAGRATWSGRDPDFPTSGRGPGRLVTTTSSGNPETSSATCSSTPCDASSAQCQSSSSSAVGRCRAASVTKAASASCMASRKCSR